MQSLPVLARLAALEAEREQRALAALDADLHGLRRQIAELDADLEREIQAAVDLAGARALAVYLEAQRQRRDAAETEMTRLQQTRAAQLARLLAGRLELKRLEVLQARLDRRRRAEALRLERKRLDELAMLMSGARR
jgi:flagellar export protein FliJ